MEKEKFDLENFPTSNSAKKMLSYVTDGFYDKSYVGKWLYQVMGIEYDEAQELAEALPEQFFPETATWGLMWHERKWNLPVRENLSYQERRRLIYQKRDYRAPMTPYRMETYLEDATGFEVRIADVNDSGDYGFVAPHPNVFKAYFIGDGTLDSKKVHEILNMLKQSHITYIVNDRVVLAINNQILQKIILQQVIFKMELAFWNTFYLNGMWSIDGKMHLNAKRRYELALYIQTEFVITNMLEYLMFQNICIRGKQYILEKVFLRRMVFKLKMSFRDAVSISNKYSIRENLISYFCINMSEKEKISDVIVETKTPDYWFFDGRVLLDGNRKLNSIYEREIIT